jgi:glutamyl/glutaminyl-tRNA synthetase
MVDMMKWTGLDWDEGPGSKAVEDTGKEGDFGPYTQSQRLHHYHKFIHTLLEVDIFFMN